MYSYSGGDGRSGCLDEIDGGMLLCCNVLASSVDVRTREWGKLRREGLRKVPVRRMGIVCDVECVLEFVCRQVKKEFDGGILDFGRRDKARRRLGGREVEGVEVIGKGPDRERRNRELGRPFLRLILFYFFLLNQKERGG